MNMQADYWNGEAGERWVKHQGKLDRSLTNIAEAWLAAVEPRATDRVLDVGCGTGATTRLVAPRVKSVVGIDISAPMLALATKLGGTFVRADASTYAFTPDFDCVVSRFGVMFFDDPIAAFTNVRRAFAPGGRLAFVCWRAFEQNPWASLPFAAVRDLLPPSPPRDPTAPGPFAFANDARLRDILTRAGYADISIEPWDTKMCLGDSTEEAAEFCMSLGPLARALIELTDDEIRPRVSERLVAMLEREGTSLGAATWIVKAR